MRRNSGDDQGRNNFLDPTMRDREHERGKSGTGVIDKDARKGEIDDNHEQRTTALGSNARKSGQDGESE